MKGFRHCFSTGKLQYPDFEISVESCHIMIKNPFQLLPFSRSVEYVDELLGSGGGGGAVCISGYWKGGVKD